MRGLDDREPLRAIDMRLIGRGSAGRCRRLGKPVRVLGSPKEAFLGKPEGLKRCVQNLLDNALRYGTAVELVIEDGVENLTLLVRDRARDSGRSTRRVFEPFYRIEASRNPATGGTGLGLSIARNIAQSIGGDVTLSNREGGGLRQR
jgi:signal transduction histidine kinase